MGKKKITDFSSKPDKNLGEEIQCTDENSDENCITTEMDKDKGEVISIFNEDAPDLSGDIVKTFTFNDENQVPLAAAAKMFKITTDNYDKNKDEAANNNIAAETNSGSEAPESTTVATKNYTKSDTDNCIKSDVKLGTASDNINLADCAGNEKSSSISNVDAANEAAADNYTNAVSEDSSSKSDSKSAVSSYGSSPKYKVKTYGMTTPVNGESFSIKRGYQFRPSTIKKLTEIKANSDNINIYYNEIIDAAICYYYDAVFNNK